MIVLTYSALNKFRNCRKQYEDRYEHHLVSLRPNDRALEVGKIVHSGLTIIHASSSVDFPWAPYPVGSTVYEASEWSEFKNKCEQALSGYEFAMVRSMLGNYDSGGIRMSPEEFLLPIVHPHTKERLPDVMLAGETDGLERAFSGGMPSGLIGEHKTASRYPDEAYIRKLRMDPQIHTYAYALGRKHGVQITKCVYNVIVKCNEKYVPLSRLEYEYKKPNMYWREVIDLDPREIERVERDIYELATQILEAKENQDRFYRNQNACFQWGRPCDYIGLCESGDSPIIAANFYKIKAPHEELTITKTIELEGPKMLTTTKSPKKKSIQDLIMFIYGPNFIGKSSLFEKMPNATYISADRALDNLDVVKQDVRSWADVERVRADIVSGQHEFKTFIFDPIDTMFDFCVKSVCEEAGVKDLNEGKLSFGLGKARVKTRFLEMVKSVTRAGYGVVFISHVREATRNVDGVDVQIQVPRLSDLVLVEILTECDLHGYCTKGYEDIKDSEGKLIEKKLIHVMKTRAVRTEYMAGSRYPELREQIPLRLGHLVRALKEVLAPEGNRQQPQQPQQQPQQEVQQG